jgi:hypothetical protein
MDTGYYIITLGPGKHQNSCIYHDSSETDKTLQNST